jgi:hypothetical protein
LSDKRPRRKLGELIVPINELSSRPLAFDNAATIARLEARLKIFGAIAWKKSQKPALDYYKKAADLIVSTSVIRHAENTHIDPQEAVKDEATTLFQRDKKIARYKRGVEIAGRTVYLSDLIKDERERLKHEEKIKPNQAPSGH